MPKILRVRAPQDEREERWVRKLAGSRHGPADWILHALMVVQSWDGKWVLRASLRLSARMMRPSDVGSNAIVQRGSMDWRIDPEPESQQKQPKPPTNSSSPACGGDRAAWGDPTPGGRFSASPSIWLSKLASSFLRKRCVIF